MESTHKKNIYVKGSKYPLPGLDDFNPQDDHSIIIDLDYYNYSNLNLFIDCAPLESASYCLSSDNSNLYHYSNDYLKIPATFDGLSFSGLIKTSDPKNYNLNALTVFPLPTFSGDKKIVFLDRDGVLNINTGYPHIPEKLVINQNILPSLKSAKSKGYEFIVITNQSGIARGIFSENDYELCKVHIDKFFKEHDISILDWFHCPYHVDGKVDEFTQPSLDRKPLPGMILKACEKHSIDLKNSIMIGDNESDNILLPYLDFKLITPNDSKLFI